MHGRCGRFARRRDGSIHLVHSKWTLIRNSFPQLSEAGLCERSHFSYGFQLLLFSVRLTRTVWLPRSFNQWRTDVAGMDQTSWWHVWSSHDRAQILPIYHKSPVFPNEPFRMTAGKLDKPHASVHSLGIPPGLHRSVVPGGTGSFAFSNASSRLLSNC